MKDAALEAKKCISSDTAYNVGAIITKIVDEKEVEVSRGYSREIEGNTHAEECALLKIGIRKSSKTFEMLRKLDDCALESARTYVLYTTMEPCTKRTSGNRSCTSRIIASGISKVVIGVKEPDNFVICEGVKLLKENNIKVEFINSAEITLLCIEPNKHLMK